MCLFSSGVTIIDILTQFHKILGSRRRNIFIVLQNNQIYVRDNRKGNPKTLATLDTRHTNKNHNRKLKKMNNPTKKKIADPMYS